MFKQDEKTITWESRKILSEDLVCEYGEFTVLYDPNSWEVLTGTNKKGDPVTYLHYCGTLCGPIDIPDGIVSAYHMFENCSFEAGAFIRYFDCSKLRSIEGMFLNATIVGGSKYGLLVDKNNDCFRFGDTFNLDNVENATEAFMGCHVVGSICSEISYSTASVRWFDRMFKGAVLDGSIPFEIDLTHALSTVEMFDSCFCKELPMIDQDMIDVLDFRESNPAYSQGMLKILHYNSGRDLIYYTKECDDEDYEEPSVWTAVGLYVEGYGYLSPESAFFFIKEEDDKRKEMIMEIGEILHQYNMC